MRVHPFGGLMPSPWGVKVFRSFSGGAPDVPIDYMWCFSFRFRTPWTKTLGWFSDVWWYATKNFYFGRQRNDNPAGRWAYVYEMRLWKLRLQNLAARMS